MHKKNDIYMVGILQEVGLPYVLLYVDKTDMSYYLFVRSLNQQRETPETGSYTFYAVPVTPPEIEAYMHGQLPLLVILQSHPISMASFKGNPDNPTLVMEALGHKFVPEKRMTELNHFDPDLCDEEMWIRTYMKRHPSSSGNLRKMA